MQSPSQIQNVSLDAPSHNGYGEKASGGKKKRMQRPCHEQPIPLVSQRMLEEFCFFFFFLNPTNMKMCQVWTIKVLPGGCYFIIESCKLLGSPHQSALSVIVTYYSRPSCALKLFPKISANSPLPSILPVKQTQIAECTHSLLLIYLQFKRLAHKGENQS